MTTEPDYLSGSLRFHARLHEEILVDPVSGRVRIELEVEPGHVPRELWTLAPHSAFVGILRRVPEADGPLPALPTAGERAVQQAGILCQERAFQGFCFDHAGQPKGYVRGFHFARAYVRKWCCVKSRAELRTNAAALTAWHQLREEYHRERGQTAWVPGSVAIELAPPDQPPAIAMMET